MNLRPLDLLSNVRLHPLAFVLLFLGTASAVNATSVIDQQQPIIDARVGGVAIGGHSTEKLGQVVTAGSTGFLTEVRFPVACDSGSDLIVEIQGVTAGVPSGAVLTSQTIPG